MCVLLVEDEALIRELMAETLEDAGFEVVQVESGQLVIELLRQPPRGFTALVTDFHMPGGVDGFEVASRVRDKYPRIPVIIASGRPEVFRADWQRHHGYEVLRKPYLPSKLVELVQTLTGAPPGVVPKDASIRQP